LVNLFYHKLHKSMIQDYSVCPYKYKLKWLEKRPILPTPESTIGKSFHTFAHDFFDLVQKEKLMQLQTADEVREYMRSVIPKVPSLVKDLCLNFVDFEVDHFLKVRNLSLDYFFPLARELYLETKIFAGTIDRLDLLTDNSICIFEYKTSQYLHMPTIRRECAFYKLLLESTSGKWRALKVSSFAVYNPVLNKFVFEKFSRNSSAALMRWIGRMKTSHEENDFPKKFGTLCRWCDFRFECLE